MKKIILILWILAVLLIQNANAQNAPITTAGEIVSYGSTAIVPISIEDFSSIGSCNLKLLYNPAIIIATAVTKEPILPGTLSSNISEPGVISLGWFTWPGVTLPDNTVIFNIVFSQIAPGYSEISWDDDGYSCAWSDDNFEYLIDIPTDDFYIAGSIDGSRYLELNVLLEGPFQTGEMTTDLNDLDILPLSQPYSGLPWNYSGTETVGSIPNTDVVDWCLIELRDAIDAPSATPSTTKEKQAAFLLKDGSVVGMDGTSNIELNHFILQQLFVVVWHRNHLGIMSAVPLTFGVGIYAYDFTTAASQAYLSGQKGLGGSNFGMYAGDADGNGEILQDDIDLRWFNEAGENGYYGGDMNMDSQANNQDKDDVWLENLNEQSQVPN
ncbi:MAG: hypothetical protein K8R74_15580 [Bacteroidales bacterium]|nr:hypothetical protein [Bacteroidales bacterium]